MPGWHDPILLTRARSQSGPKTEPAGSTQGGVGYVLVCTGLAQLGRQLPSSSESEADRGGNAPYKAISLVLKSANTAPCWSHMS